MFALLASVSLCFCWNGDSMVPRLTSVGLDEESCRKPDAPTLADWMAAKRIELNGIQHLFGHGVAATIPNAYSLGGMSSRAPRAQWRALALFMGLERIAIFPAGGCPAEFEALARSERVSRALK